MFETKAKMDLRDFETPSSNQAIPLVSSKLITQCFKGVFNPPRTWTMEENHLISNSRTKNWGDLKQAVRELRRQISCLSSRVPSSFSFRLLSPSVIRIYFLCSPSNGRETTLFFCDVDTNFSW